MENFKKYIISYYHLIVDFNFIKFIIINNIYKNNYKNYKSFIFLIKYL
jgi:hypothetical protein